jgi:serine/threonine-protein kinase
VSGGAGVQRYMVHGPIGRGGTATVHLGTLVGDLGFTRTVAIKRLHEGLATNEQLIASLIDEARITSRIFHPNVVPTLEIVATGGDLYVVMEYVEGEPLSRILSEMATRGERIPVPIVASLMVGALRGLHAAHEAHDEMGAPLGIIHRDVSPQNVMVGTDGLAHIVDFGVAKAVGRVAQTRQGEIKGKLGYMPPEQLHDEVLDRRVDVYAAGVLLWEALTSGRLFRGKTDAETIGWIKSGRVAPPSTRVPGISPELDAVVMKAVARDRDARFPDALAMAEALAAATRVASTDEVAAWARVETADAIAARKAEIATAATNPAMVTLTSTGPSTAVREAARQSAHEVAFENATTLVRPSVSRRRLVVVAALVALALVLTVVTFAAVRASRRDPGHRPAIPQITPTPGPETPAH